MHPAFSFYVTSSYCPPVMSELLHQLLPVAAGAQVSFVESPDVLHDFLSLHALPQRHILGDVGSNLGYVFGLSVQPLDEAVRGDDGVDRKVKNPNRKEHIQRANWNSSSLPLLSVDNFLFPRHFACFLLCLVLQFFLHK